jgi:diguanylate cyclase (GGDEF)-like protein/PAS domain S-box-containing protein
MKLSGDAFRTMCRRYRTAWLSAVVGLAAVALLSVIAVQIFSAHRNADARLAHALRIKGDVETLQAVHVDANSDFLKGLGTSLAASYAWPVSRVGAAVRGYDDLEQAYAGDPASAKVVRQLREATAQWAWRLEGVTAGASRRGPAIEIDSVALLSANEMLSEIAHALAALRMAQDDFLRDSGNEAAQRMASEQTILAIAATASILLLIYGFIANHRAGLARAKVRIVAEEAEIRFREYFENHPLAMMIYDVKSLRVLAGNEAAAEQYGYTRDEMTELTVTALRAPEEIAPFLADLASFIARSSASGSAGVRRHMHRDGTPILVQVSFHFLKYGNRDACFIVAIDVTAHEHAERALRKSKRMLQTVIDTVPHRIFWKDSESRYVGCNRAFAQDVGLADVAQVVGMTDDQMPWHENAGQVRALDAQVIQSGIALCGHEEHRQLLAGEKRWLRETRVALEDPQERAVGVLTLYEDVSGRKDSELALRLRSRALDAIVNAVLITRPGKAGNVIEYANPAFERITGYRYEDVVGCDCKFLQANDRNQAGIDKIRQAIREEREVTTLLRNYRNDGSLFWNQLYIAPVPDEHGTVTHHISVINDVSEVVQSHNELRSQARFDALTSLPNRITLGERLQEAIERAASNKSRVALVFMDVDHFKDVNDSLGHSAGDRLLREVATRLAGCIGPQDTIARYGGDEFVLVVSESREDERLDNILAQVQAVLERPVVLDDIDLQVEFSVGVAHYPEHAGDVETLLKNADLAMYGAKKNGRNSVQRFVPALAQAAEERIALSRRMRLALKNGDFSVHYQPQIDLRTNRVTGVEALLRWVDPEFGSVSPASFIPIAEENGLIGPIGEWVLNEACTQAKMWECKLPGVRMSVNVSPRQFGHGDLLELVERALAMSQLSPSKLELEITEGALMTYGALPTLQAVRKLGVGIAIDDFGTGYSSLGYVRNFHADRLKLDMSFVRGIGVSREDEAITRAILALGRTLQFEVVAEGVETAEQLTFLALENCSTIQGYYFAHPMTASVAEAFIEQYNMGERVGEEAGLPVLQDAR